MALIVCDVSGIWFWRKAPNRMRPFDSVVTSAEAERILNSFRPVDKEVRAVLPWLSPKLAPTGKIHLLVNNKVARRNSAMAMCHVWSSRLSGASLCMVGKGVYVISPEFCLLVAATRGDRIDLLLLILEFCGYYSLRPDIPKGMTQRRAPLTSVSSIWAFVDERRGQPGSYKLVRAMKFAVDGIASPMEAVLYMLLCLPQRMGGYGIPAPIPNFESSLFGLSAEMTEKSWCSTDLYWPEANLIVEYDSDAEHTGGRKIASDARRRNAITGMASEVITVTNEQLHDEQNFDAIAHFIMSRIGHRWHEPSYDFARVRGELRRRLLGSDTPLF